MNTWASGFDTHEDGWGIVFDVIVSGSEDSGIQVRAPYTTVSASVDNTRAAAIHVVSDRGDGATINLRRAYRTNQGGTANINTNHGDGGIDKSVWVDRGAIFVDANDCYIQSYNIEECGGPGLQFFSGVFRVTIGAGRIKNPNQIGTTNTAAIDSQATAAATYTFVGAPHIESDDGNMDYSFAADNAAANFIGSYSSSGAVIGEFDNGGTGASLGMLRLQSAGANWYDDLLTLDETNRRVGIGEVSPVRPLHVNIGTNNEAARFESSTAF